ncbi:SulP family inorganic anion transporter [Paenibacillus sp. OV219]|uniref:SulP family inorganic anion transporter n=1 Tax=Paenibacillus sp. OV219 TaxID=1884377 RepID=UPI0008D522E7|nr:SulP family inorganic anion transporter [Paenibacillus sp. OV219]SEO53563.1 sulfate permease, SulP family [Paenibacillus sp. OV219]
MNWSSRFKGYNLESLQRDIVSGLIVGIVAIPLAMSFAIASGVKPQYGIYTTIVAGFLISLLGGSKFQIGGPTGAFIPILVGVVLQYGYENLLIAGFLAGLLLVLMGVFRLGILIQFIPRPVTIGFTAGIAVIIFSGQISNFLGLKNISRHNDFFSNMREIVLHLPTLSLYSLLTATICLIVMLLTPKYLSKFPASLMGLIVSTLVSMLLFKGEISTIGSAYGAIPSSLPVFSLPHITLEKIVLLIQPALVIAMLGGIESLLSAVVADGMTGSRHNSNRELIGQGIANIGASLFGGIPATGAIARTATNIKSGAASPVSGMVHGLVVLIILMLFAPLASDIPLSSMAPILMVVAWNMSERKHFAQLLRAKTSESMIMVVTFILTVFLNLTIAVEMGLLLAAFMFMVRMRNSLRVTKVQYDNLMNEEDLKPYMMEYDSRIGIYSIEGPLFFGTANKFEELFENESTSNQNVLIINLKGVSVVDSTGESKLATIVSRTVLKGGTIILLGLQQQIKEFFRKSGFVHVIGEENIFDDYYDAIYEAHRRTTALNRTN